MTERVSSMQLIARYLSTVQLVEAAGLSEDSYLQEMLEWGMSPLADGHIAQEALALVESEAMAAAVINSFSLAKAHWPDVPKNKRSGRP